MADWPRISKLRALLMRPTNLRIMTTEDWNQRRVDVLATGVPYEVLTHPDYEYGYWTEASLLRILDDLAGTIEAGGADVEDGEADVVAVTIGQILAHAIPFDDGESQSTGDGDASSRARFTPQTVDHDTPATSDASLCSEENDGDSEEDDHTSKSFTGHAMTKKDAEAKAAGVIPDPKAKKPWNCPVKGCNVACVKRDVLVRHLQVGLLRYLFPAEGCSLDWSRDDRVRPHVRNVHPQIVLSPRWKPNTIESSAAPAPVQKKRARGGDEDDAASNSKRRRITTS
ncbi:hypothetical protein EXIGLDRAFT_759331 [Exidia glandulosa HHB12029]|uniref:C2H2-type domain-containing protein n=1 Tax=Exidia glandulosa HHB12029 TaxID=1314781 RepID=A0A165Q355_EXIGL|nr:hypothetical protein EXIGLDRAFT_759331 [Exidia glandulosa HHB12029]